MAKQFIFRTKGLLKMNQELQNQIARFPDMQQKALRAMSIYMVRETKKRFDTSIGPDGRPWKPLSGLTKQARKKGRGRAGSGHKPLLSTGTLKRSIAPTWLTKSEVMIGPGSNLTYAKYHQSGASWIRTKKQAWWMVFNLFGFDPEKPEKFFSKEQRRETRKSARRRAKKFFGAGAAAGISRKEIVAAETKSAMSFIAWRYAKRIADRLTGSKATITARPFAGINKTNMNVLEGIALRTAMKHILPKGKGG